MASDKIKGLTVKIGADTSDFIKQLKKVDKEINYSEKQARELQKQLQFEFNEKKFLTAQSRVRSDLEATEQKARAIKEQLKYIETSVEDGINTEGYKKLQVELEKTETQALKLNSELEKLDKIKFENSFKGIKKLGSGLETAAKKTAILSATSVGAIAGIYKLGSDAAKTGGELQDLADRLNVSAEAIQRYDYIALQSGVDTEQLVKSMAKARDAIGTGLAGTSNTATQTLEKLFGDLRQIPTGTEEGFTAIIDKLSQVEDSTMQAYYANEIFGERLATNLVPLINNGADKLAKFNSEFEAIGYLSNDQVQALADFDDELNIMKERLELAKTELGTSMIPLMETFVGILEDDVVPAIEKVSDWFDDLSPSMQKVITGGLLLFSVLSPVLSVMSKLINVIPNLVKFLGSLKDASWQTYAGFAALSGAVALGFDIIGNWKQMSTVEKILKSLALAALVAAAAITVFQAAWSWGIAIGAITAGIVAGIAAVNSAGKSIGLDPKFKDENDLKSVAGQNYDIPSYSNGGSGNTYNEDNSQYNINVSLNATGDLNYDSKALAEEVIKQLAVKKQSSGR